MIQIIGFLACAMLAVKLLEMSVNPALRDNSGGMKPSLTAALILGWASVFGFAFCLYAQGQAFEATPTLTEQADEANQIADCMEAAQTLEAMIACQR